MRRPVSSQTNDLIGAKAEIESTPARLQKVLGVELCLGRVRRQNIQHNSRRKLAEFGPRLGVDVMRRACGVASAGVRWFVA
jgi:hypothetical protein